MIQDTITQIEARIQNAKSLNGEKKKELLDLVDDTVKIPLEEISIQWRVYECHPMKGGGPLN